MPNSILNSDIQLKKLENPYFELKKNDEKAGNLVEAQKVENEQFLINIDIFGEDANQINNLNNYMVLPAEDETQSSLFE